MVTDIVNIIGLRLAILRSRENTSDVGLAFGAGTEACRIRKQCLQKLNRNDLLPLKNDGCCRQHSHIFQTSHMIQIALSECHEETDSFHPRDILRQRLYFFMMQQIHILLPHLVKIILSLNAHGRDLHPVAVFPVAARCGYLPQIDLRVKISGKRISMISAITVQNIDRINGIKFMFCGIRTVSLGHTGIEAAAQQCRKSRLLKFLFISPLPGVVKIGGKSFFLTAFFIDGAPRGILCILRFIIGGIHIIDTAGKAGIHNGKVLIRKRNVHYQLRPVFPDQCDHLVHIIRIHLCRSNDSLCLSCQLLCQRITLFLRPAGNTQFREYLAHLTTFLNCYTGYTAAADH